MNTAILKMIQVCDSLFPIGAFTLSNGWETLVAQNQLRSSMDLKEYVSSFLDILPYNDLGTMMLAYAHSDEKEYIKELDSLAIALKAPSEIRVGSEKLCRRFLKIWQDHKEYERLTWYFQKIKERRVDGCHAIAAGLYAKEIGLPQKIAGEIYGYSLLTAVVTNVVKTVPLSQMDGQKILAESQEQIGSAVAKAEKLERDDLGVGGTAFDIAGMNHEILYSRLYMS